MDRVKNSKDRLVRYGAVVLLTALLFGVGFYWVDRIVTPEGKAEELYDEPQNSIDVLILGGSQSMGSISCTELYTQTGLTAFSFTTWSQPVWVSYYYMKEAMKTQSPKVVLLDVFGAFYDRTYMTGVDFDLVSDDCAALLRPSWNLLELNYARRRVQVTRKHWYEYLNIAKYHSRITQLTADSVLKLVRDDSTPAKGYGPFYTKEDFSGYEYPQTGEVIELYPYAEEYLRRTIEFCQKKGVQIVLIKLPHVADANDCAVLNKVKIIAEEYGVDLLDYCSTNALGLDFSGDFADHGHLNYNGAEKATSAVVEYLRQNVVPAQHEQKIAQRWEAAAKTEKREHDEMRVRMADSFEKITALAEAQGSSAMILVKQDAGALTAEDYEKIRQLFTGTPFEAVQEKLEATWLLVLEDGILLENEAAAAWCLQAGITAEAHPKATIIADDVNYSYERDGWNLAVLNTETGRIYHKISFAKEHDYKPYTS